ncbi:MAG: DUF4373 domain-containing protein [Thermoguttaceae bacterium]|nr:DUF4373 domain-containing protein [Thermoguttaceae bacterium]
MTWFKHETNTARDPRILRLKATHGGAACFTYILLLEYLRDTETGQLDKADIPFIASCNLMEDTDTAAAIINECLKLKLLEADGNFIYSPMLLEQMEEQKHQSEKRSLAGKKGQQAKREKQEATAAALTAVESVTNDTVKELVKEICETFKVEIKPYYYQYTEILIKEATPISPKYGDGAAIIREGLKKYRESEAIQSGAIGFNINSFFDPEKFLKLLAGDYDKPFPPHVKRKIKKKL